MTKIAVQIYEIQNPEEAAKLVELGVDHIGSVIPYMDQWLVEDVRETIRLQKNTPAQSSLIPLTRDKEAIMRALDYYQPDIIHFCETIPCPADEKTLSVFMSIQKEVREAFPQIMIMRSIPIPPYDVRNSTKTVDLVLDIARLLEPYSDYFLTDTVLGNGNADNGKDQPEEGYVGITGKTCDWEVAAALVRGSKIPVVLAGGISPENVFAAISKVRPWGVDSCTRTNVVDDSGMPVRFRKDMKKVKRFISETRTAEKVLS